MAVIHDDDEALLLFFNSLPLLDEEYFAITSVDFRQQSNPSTPSEPTVDLDDRSADQYSAEGRRLSRKISNRESARRSRDRKRRRLEELRSEETKLRRTKQDLAARLETARHRSRLFRRDSERLRLESDALQRRLAVCPPGGPLALTASHFGWYMWNPRLEHDGIWRACMHTMPVDLTVYMH